MAEKVAVGAQPDPGVLVALSISSTAIYKHPSLRPSPSTTRGEGAISLRERNKSVSQRATRHLSGKAVVQVEGILYCLLKLMKWYASQFAGPSVVITSPANDESSFV